MRQLEPPDTHYLSAASGWLGLGNPLEARIELKNLSPAVASHPDVLEVVYDICAAEKNWAEAVKTAEAIAETVPDRPTGWLHLAYALHELKRTKEALEVLQPIIPRFSHNWLMRYNMACYECQLGNPEASWENLRQAIKLGNKAEVLRMALDDRDLEPMHRRIEKLKHSAV